jgi:hypothetical protein
MNRPSAIAAEPWTCLSSCSLRAFIPAALSVVVLIIRTCWADQMRQAELPGYKVYAKPVRYKWIPWVW